MDSKTKTYKRETAVAMLVFLAGLFGYGIWFSNGQALESAEFLTLPIFSFSGLAFGFDAYSKQVAR